MVLGLLVVFAMSTGSLLADRRPEGCNANNLNFHVVRDLEVASQGQIVKFTIEAMNNGPGACDIEHAEVVFLCPDMDGNPEGELTVLSAPGGDDFPADGSGDRIYPHVNCTIDIGRSVEFATAIVAAGDRANRTPTDLSKGIVHDGGNCPFNFEKSLTVEIGSGSSSSSESPGGDTTTAGRGSGGR